MISDFYSIFKSPLKILAKKIKNCRNFDDRDFRARGPKLPMATKSRILKLECSQATWTFIDHTSKGRSKESSQKQSSLRLLPPVSNWSRPTLICNFDDPPFSGLSIFFPHTKLPNLNSLYKELNKESQPLLLAMHIFNPISHGGPWFGI